jgi:hypothetical protein
LGLDERYNKNKTKTVDDDDGMQRDGCNGMYHPLEAGGRA